MRPILHHLLHEWQRLHCGALYDIDDEDSLQRFSNMRILHLCFNHTCQFGSDRAAHAVAHQVQAVLRMFCKDEFKHGESILNESRLAELSLVFARVRAVASPVESVNNRVDFELLSQAGKRHC